MTTLEQAREALESLANAYKRIADSGDSGNWLAEEQPDYIAARAALSAIDAALAAQEVPAGEWVMVQRDLLHDAISSVEDYRAGVDFGTYDRKLIYRLKAALAPAAPKQEAWRPIETAPKDGSEFLCWVWAVRYGETDEGQQYQQDVSQASFCNWRTQADIPDCGWFDPCCGQIADQQAVTHWMPLPPAPAAPQD